MTTLDHQILTTLILTPDQDKTLRSLFKYLSPWDLGDVLLTLMSRDIGEPEEEIRQALKTTLLEIHTQLKETRASDYDY